MTENGGHAVKGIKGKMGERKTGHLKDIWISCETDKAHS